MQILQYLVIFRAYLYSSLTLVYLSKQLGPLDQDYHLQQDDILVDNIHTSKNKQDNSNNGLVSTLHIYFFWSVSLVCGGKVEVCSFHS